MNVAEGADRLGSPTPGLRQRQARTAILWRTTALRIQWALSRIWCSTVRVSTSPPPHRTSLPHSRGQCRSARAACRSHGCVAHARSNTRKSLEPDRRDCSHGNAKRGSSRNRCQGAGRRRGACRRGGTVPAGRAATGRIRERRLAPTEDLCLWCRATPVHDAIVEVHSHHAMRAYFSATDDRDETGRRIYGVLGRLDGPHPEIALRVASGCNPPAVGPVPFSQVFAGDLGEFRDVSFLLRRLDRHRPLVRPRSAPYFARGHDSGTKLAFCSKSPKTCRQFGMFSNPMRCIQRWLRIQGSHDETRTLNPLALTPLIRFRTACPQQRGRGRTATTRS